MKHFTPPKIPAARPTAGLIADARKVVANPEQYAGRPLLRRLAWMTLLSQRGRVADQSRLAQMPVECWS